MGLTYDYFYSLTPRVFFNIHEGFNQRVEMEFKDNWLRTRKLMFAMLKPHLKNKNATEIDLFSFPWETESNEIEEILSAEKADEIIQQQIDYWEAIDRKRMESKA
ncbi:hypothetical protein P3875_04125 [Myroides sp. JBRI-B21084]|uniref:hypothetical protein n=1 Tax=Myroides sp. JBRI-B21084 TaxID=3119977 RepID=UPI0026E38ACB|nr:hypothetical protein [Paenimyroides cloacae]WKW47259.1 hypothetical protein P3875_04125 [Paenimyroides cloacae]